MHRPKRIIVRAPNWVGDHVMAFPFYTGLRKAYSDAHISLLSLENISTLEYRHWFDDQIILSREKRHSFSETLRLSREVAKGNYDLSITIPTSVSAALLFFLSNIPSRVGFGEGGSEIFHTASIAWTGRTSKKHKSDLYRELLDFLLAAPVSREDSQYVWQLPESERENVIVVAPGASLPLREWPYYQVILKEIRKRYWAFRLVVVGSESETKWHSILKRINDPKIEDWVGRTSLPQLVEICKKAKLVIANDSGVAHLAASMAGTPIVVLFGPGDPDYIRPTGAQVEVARVEDLACSPCESAKCQEKWGYQQCLRSLSPQSVLGKIEHLLS